MKNLLHQLKVKISIWRFRYRLWKTEQHMKKHLKNRAKNVSRETKKDESTNVQNPVPRKMGNRPLH